MQTLVCGIGVGDAMSVDVGVLQAVVDEALAPGPVLGNQGN